MSSPLERLGGIKATSPTYRVTPTYLNTNNNQLSSYLLSLSRDAYQITALNFIRMLQDRTVDVSLNQLDLFGDAFIDADGRLNSVNTGETTAAFITSEFIYVPYFTTDEATSDTLHDPNSVTNPSNAFDGDLNTAATWSGSTNFAQIRLGRTFSAKTNLVVFIKASVSGNAGGSPSSTIRMQTFDGSTWTNYKSYSGSAFQGWEYINFSVQGIRVEIQASSSSAGTKNLNWFLIEYGAPDESEVTLDIPAGTFPASPDYYFGTPLISAWEEGAKIEYRFENATQETAYSEVKPDQEILIDDSLTSEPTKLRIKLTPKDTSPTAGVPAIKGFAGIARNLIEEDES
jgi:hypothetical protein